jgi:tetratricopeptide (TPR) repeat protein
MRSRPAASILRAVAVAAALAPAAPARAGVAEGWYVLRGRSNMKIGNYRAAVEAYQKAVELDPGNREASRALGIAYEKNGETDRAIAQFDRYLERFHDDPEIAFRQARYLGWSRYGYRRGDAIRYYRMGLARQDDPVRRHELARLLANDRATLDEALEEYRRLLARDGGNRALRAEYQKLLLWDERHRGEAADELARDADERPGDGDAQLRVARLLAGDPARAGAAAERYRKAIDARPKDAALRLELARFLLGAKRKPEALDAYQGALELRPGDGALRLEYARLLLGERGRRADGVAELGRCVEARPKDRALRLEYARVLLGEPGRRADALEQYRRALAQEGDAKTRLEYARVLLGEPGRRAEALEQYRLALEGQNDPKVRLEYARLLAGEPERRDEALAQYQTLTATTPQSREVRLAYARLLGARRDTTPDAIAQYERAVEARPDDVEAHAGLARAYAWSGEGDRALLHASAALEQDPSRHDLAALRAELERGREPWAGGAARALAVDRGEGSVSGQRAGVRASRDATAFGRLTVEAGAARYAGEGTTASGAYAVVDVEGRPDAGTRVDARFSYDGVREGAAAAGGRLALTRGRGEGAWTLSLERRARDDSATALLGGGPAAARLGLATENAAALGFGFGAGALRVDLRPCGGVVTHATTEANAFVGGTAALGGALAEGGGWTLRAALETSAMHYASDRSALAVATPVAGAATPPRPSDGYFSPALFLGETARLVLSKEVALAWRVEAALGPALQFVADDAGQGLHLGGEARVALWHRAGDRFWWSLAAKGERVGDAYSRFDVEGAAGVMF